MAENDPVHQTRFFFDSPALPGVAVQVVSVEVVEAIGEPYAAELSISSRDVDLADLLGNDCALTIERGGSATRRVCGIVRAIEEGRRDEHAYARVVVVPALWFLSRRRDTRIFQEKTAVDILEEVLKKSLSPYSRSIRNELRGSYPKREFCVQYAETDLAFCHRLMEEEGIFYAFEHDGEKEVLVLFDANDACPAVSGGDGVLYYQPDDRSAGDEPVQHVHRVHASTTTSVVVRDWDWTKNGKMIVEGEARGEDAMKRDRESYEHDEGRSLTIYEYKPEAYGKNDASTQPNLRKEAYEAAGSRLFGLGRVPTMAPGTTFSLVDHPTPGFDGEYLVTRVEHSSEAAEALFPTQTILVRQDHYRTVFECIPKGRPFRLPRRTPKPAIAGVQTAVVTGPSGEEIHVDEHGRIKIHFHWDRLGALDEKSSCWIRVEQAWAGSSWGFWWVPRIGMEVVVQFVDGDPDRPLVTGCVYDGTNATPYPLPDEKTKSTIKSNSSIGGGGSNEFRFEDLSGSEEIYTHAQKDYNEVVENDHTTLVHHDQKITVDHDQVQLVKVDQTETVNGNQTMTVDKDRTVHVGGNFDETVDGTETRTVKSNVSETFDANETRTISGNVTESITGNETRTITGNQDESITGSHTRTISGASTETITGSLSATVTGGVTTTTPATYSILANGGFTATAAAGITLVAPGGLLMLAPGGIRQVDERDFWTGTEIVSVGSASLSRVAIKYEAVGISLGVTTVKTEATGFKCETDNLAMKENTFMNELSAARLKDALKMSFKAWENHG